MWMDVDTALAEVPVNILPLTDDTDFKSREEAVAYNAAGLELIWHFTTTAGATSATVVTPTTGGAYDWAHQRGALYTIEIPASGGASINNDTEGFGFFTGVATGILPWRGPVIGFRAAGINNALIDGAWSATRGLGGPTALPDAAADAAGGLPISDAGGLDLDTYIKRLEAAWTAALAARIDENISAAKTLTAGYDAAKTAAAAGAAMTLTAAYDAAKTAAAAGAKMDLVDAPNATAVTAIQSGLAATGEAATAAGAVTVAGYATGKSPAELVTGFSTHSAADVKTAVEAVGSHLALIKAKTDNLPANTSTVLGTPAGASLAADIAGVTAPSAADVADAVWNEANADHVAAGSTGKALADAGAAGDPWSTAVPGAYGAGTAGKVFGDILEDTGTTLPALFSAGTVTLTAPVSTDGETVTLVQGDDYYLADSRHLSWTDSGSEWPSLTGATIHFTVRDLATGTDTETHGVVSDANTCYVELPNTTTVLWDAGGKFRFDLEATLAGTSHKVTLVTGVVTMTAKYSG
jgi:hypothetical protein